MRTGFAASLFAMIAGGWAGPSTAEESAGIAPALEPAALSAEPWPAALSADSIPDWFRTVETAAEPAHAPAVPASAQPRPGFLDALRSGFALDPMVDEPKVRQEIDWVVRNPRYLERLSPRMDRHLPGFCNEVRARGMPSEICLLPIIESALDPFAFSPGGAAGFWQFIPGTAKRYGLKIDWWVDERRDPYQSTDAALRYLSDLFDRFDDWLLAVAAYNWGEGNVSRAKRRAGKQASFFDLKVPRETAAYVPRLLAFSAIFADPSAYGIDIPGRIGRNEPLERSYVEVSTGSQMDIARVAEASGLGVEDLYRLNPSLNQWATHPRGPHRLLVPANVSVSVQRALADVPDGDRVRWQRHRIAGNETLGHIAQRYRTDVATIKKANGLRSNTIRAGEHLLIPKSSLAASDYPTPLRRREAQGSIYVVRPGDSLWEISQRTGVSVDKLMRTNHVGPRDFLRVGQRLVLTGAGQRDVVRSVRYRVKNGDSLARIAGKFNVSIADIVSWNRLDPSGYIHPGQKLDLRVNVTAPRG